MYIKLGGNSVLESLSVRVDLTTHESQACRFLNKSAD